MSDHQNIKITKQYFINRKCKHWSEPCKWCGTV